MKRELAGKRVVVTGAWSGIGLALTEQLAAAGARLILAARSADKLDALVEELKAGGTEAEAVAGDLTEPATRDRVAAAVRDRWGALDVLINNAGVEASGHFATSDGDILRRVMEVNFFAPAELTRVSVPLLARGDRPAVMFVGSRCGRRGLPAWSEYSASKFALAGLAEALRGEFARFGVDVLLTVPGFTVTPFREHALRCEARENLKGRKGMSADYVAGKVLESVRKGREEYNVGVGSRWLLRANRWFPRLTDRLIARRVRKNYAKDGG